MSAVTFSISIYLTTNRVMVFSSISSVYINIPIGVASAKVACIIEMAAATRRLASPVPSSPTARRRLGTGIAHAVHEGVKVRPDGQQPRSDSRDLPS